MSGGGVALRVGQTANLGQDDEILAGNVELLDSFANENLRVTVRVSIGSAVGGKLTTVSWWVIWTRDSVCST